MITPILEYLLEKISILVILLFLSIALFILLIIGKKKHNEIDKYNHIKLLQFDRNEINKLLGRTGIWNLFFKVSLSLYGVEKIPNITWINNELDLKKVIDKQKNEGYLNKYPIEKNNYDVILQKQKLASILKDSQEFEIIYELIKGEPYDSQLKKIESRQFLSFNEFIIKFIKEGYNNAKSRYFLFEDINLYIVSIENNGSGVLEAKTNDGELNLRFLLSKGTIIKENQLSSRRIGETITKNIFAYQATQNTNTNKVFMFETYAVFDKGSFSKKISTSQSNNENN